MVNIQHNKSFVQSVKMFGTKTEDLEMPSGPQTSFAPLLYNSSGLTGSVDDHILRIFLQVWRLGYVLVPASLQLYLYWNPAKFISLLSVNLPGICLVCLCLCVHLKVSHCGV